MQTKHSFIHFIWKNWKYTKEDDEKVEKWSWINIVNTSSIWMVSICCFSLKLGLLYTYIIDNAYCAMLNIQWVSAFFSRYNNYDVRWGILQITTGEKNETTILIWMWLSVISTILYYHWTIVNWPDNEIAEKMINRHHWSFNVTGLKYMYIYVLKIEGVSSFNVC